MRLTFLDRSESRWFENQITWVQEEVINWEFGETKNRRLIPTKFAPNPGIQAIETRMHTITGMWKLIENHGQDLPLIDKYAVRSQIKPKIFGAAYSYTKDEIRTARMNNLNLDTDKATDTKLTYEQQENTIAWFGDAVAKLQGFIAHPLAIKMSLPADGKHGGTSITSKAEEPSKILRDLNSIANISKKMSMGRCIPDTLLLPPDDYTAIATSRIDATSDTTILEFFMKANRHITLIEDLPELSGAGDNGGDIYQCYHRNPKSVVNHVVLDFTQYPPQDKGLDALVPCEAKLAGVELKRPLTCAWTEVTSPDKPAESASESTSDNNNAEGGS